MSRGPHEQAREALARRLPRLLASKGIASLQGEPLLAAWDAAMAGHGEGGELVLRLDDDGHEEHRTYERLGFEQGVAAAASYLAELATERFLREADDEARELRRLSKRLLAECKQLKPPARPGTKVP